MGFEPFILSVEPLYGLNAGLHDQFFPAEIELSAVTENAAEFQFS